MNCKVRGYGIYSDIISAYKGGSRYRGMLKIRNNEVKKVIKIMKEVATWGRDKGLRVWLDQWLTEEVLV